MTRSDNTTRVSIAMATYNGERFLEPQLESIARQTRLPDEVVVQDDCSQDETVALLERFADRIACPVEVMRNTSRRGYRHAFVSAATACSGELVAFCDQDDVWMPQKLERCVHEFDRNPDVTLVAHSAAVIDSSERWSDASYPRYRRRRVIAPNRAPVMAQLPGFSIVVSRRPLDPWSIRPRDTGYCWDHDDWATTIAAAAGLVVLLPDRLVAYRQHEANTWGTPALKLTDRITTSLAYRGDEPQLYRGLADWASEHVTLMDEVHRRMVDVRDSSFWSGPASQRALWERLASANTRRAELYSSRSSRLRSAVRLASHVLRGDYGRRERGGLGASSLARDALRTVGLLEVLSRAWSTPG